MAGIATAVIGGAIIGGAASIYAADQSADAIGDAAASSNNTQLAMYNDQKRLFEPFYQQGLSALPYMQGSLDGKGRLVAKDGTKIYKPPEQGLSTSEEIDALNRWREYDAAGGKTYGDWALPSGSDPGQTQQYREFIKNYGNNFTYDTSGVTPSYEDTVYNPMEAWNYESSPAYAAKKSLVMESLSNQLNARGLNTGGMAATRASDVDRKLISEDYDKERMYRQGQITDLYKGRLSENTDRYNKILDMIKVGQGAAGSLGQANNVYASAVGQNTMDAGGAQADFYSGLAGMPTQVANTGLRTYDYGKRAGWWGGNETPSFPQASTNTLPTQAELAPYDSIY